MDSADRRTILVARALLFRINLELEKTPKPWPKRLPHVRRLLMRAAAELQKTIGSWSDADKAAAIRAAYGPPADTMGSNSGWQPDLFGHGNNGIPSTDAS